VEVRLSEILAGFSHALDVTEGQPRGHAQRSCLIGMELASRLGLGESDRSELFYALLLKDAGCSSNASKVAVLYGNDDAAVKRDRKLTNHLRTSESVRSLLRNTAPGGSPLAKARHLGALAAHGSRGARELTVLRCERGADVAEKIGLGAGTRAAIHSLDEHWDGRGYPAGLAGEEIPLPGRIICLAQTAEVSWQVGGPGAACEVARDRSGTWFEPALVEELCAIEGDPAFWDGLELPDVSRVEPRDRVLVADDEQLDRVAEAFATVVDAKSPYTAKHSAGVAEIAVGLARALGLDADAEHELRRAGLLHDIGKLGVSSRILDKAGRLDDEEWEQMRRHPQLSFEILHQVRALRGVARLAVAHHERLDGSGYLQGLGADQLGLDARILMVADVAEALSAERPYRLALEARRGPSGHDT
jgi:putative nucleotidyltransferase with HDIG domain